MLDFEGIVTSIFSSYGIIDEEIYFDFSTLDHKGDFPQLGSKVRGSKEHQGDDVYRATSVQVIDELVLEKSEVSGMLNSIKNDLGFVCDVPFKLEQCVIRPRIGDMLNLNLEEINGMTIGSTVTHIRKKRFTSYVLKVSPNICHLEDAIYFTRDVCPNGYNPQPNDIVTGFAVECCFKDFVWRVVELKPTSSTFHTMNEPLRLYKLPSFCMNRLMRECERGDEGDLVMIKPHAVRINQHLNPGDTARVNFNLKNMSSNILLDLWKVKTSGGCHVRLDLPSSYYLHPKSEVEVPVTLLNPDIGQHKTILSFAFRIGGKVLHISRTVHINVIPPKTKECLRAKTINEPFLEGSTVIPGLRPERKAPRFYPNHFPSYHIPDEITATTEDQLLAAELNIHNYKVIMHKLLFMEERFVEDEMKTYSIYGTSLVKRGRFLVLKVPSLVESKLNILIGHRVILQQTENSINYEGYIHKIDEENEELMIGFEESYHDGYDCEYVDIHFCHSRTSFIRCHLAIDFIVKQGPSAIFPTSVNVKCPYFNLPKLKLFNTSLNREQVSAVRHIIEAKARPLPYLLFGPPGTGKTVTIVEAILQIYHLQEDSRILVTAPSNSACDLICQRLLMNSEKLDIVRLNSLSRYTLHLPDEIRKISMPADEVKEAALKRIIISTCVNSGNLYKLALRTSHFTHVFIDEAGQAIEAEVMLPIALSTGPGTQAVLAGDPYQLGPVVRNPQCEQLGLEISLLERLMDLRVYERCEHFAEHNYYDPILLTKLVRNYRSHPDLLTVPSLLFYNNELVPCAPASLINRGVNSNVTLPNPNIPLIFHGVIGEEAKENRNPSPYNPTEIVQVLTYIKTFLKAGFTSADIGVITPYRKQAEKTRMMLQGIRDIDHSNIKVASVEDFQGQERPVIIVSTVRSNFMTLEKHRMLGFLQNPKRFNVAITRAQALLVVVGNPDVLKIDENWNALLEYAVSHNCYVGCHFNRV